MSARDGAKRIALVLVLALAGCGDGAGDEGESGAAPLCPAFACPDGAEPTCTPSENLGPVEVCRCADQSYITRHNDGRLIGLQYETPFQHYACLPNGRASTYQFWDDETEKVVAQSWDGDGYPTDFMASEADRCRAWVAEGVKLTCR